MDLSILGPGLQPDRLVLHENLVGDGVTMPQAEGLAADFYGKNFLVPKGQTPPLLGHPVALLIYRDFDTFEAAKRRLRFAENVVKYGAATGPNTPPNYGAARYVRIGGDSPTASSVYSPMQDAVIWGAFDGNKPV